MVILFLREEKEGGDETELVKVMEVVDKGNGGIRRLVVIIMSNTGNLDLVGVDERF